MLGKIFGILCLVSLAAAILTGNTASLGSAFLDGASGAVTLTLSLGGTMCLWCGLMRVFSEAGLVRRLSRLLSPVLRLFFPEAYRTGEGLEEISANVSANLLGIGNAATPLAISAMQKMQARNRHPETATAEQITLAVLNTASVTLIPANLLALRRAAGSERPYAVLIPIWITSLLCAAVTLLLTSIPRLFAHTSAKKASKGEKKQ